MLLKYFLTCIQGSAPSYNSITNSCCVLTILLLHKVRVGTSVWQGAFGQRSQGHGGSAGVSCAGPGAGLDDPHVSLQLRISRCAVSPSPTHLCRHPRSWCGRCWGRWRGAAGPARTWSGATRCWRSGSASRAPRSRRPGSTRCPRSRWCARRACSSGRSHCSASAASCWWRSRHSLCRATGCKENKKHKNKRRLSWKTNISSRCNETWELS